MDVDYFEEQMFVLLLPGMLVQIKGDQFDDGKSRYGNIILDERKQSSSPNDFTVMVKVTGETGQVERPFQVTSLNLLSCCDRDCKSKSTVVVAMIFITLYVYSHFALLIRNSY